MLSSNVGRVKFKVLKQHPVICNGRGRPRFAKAASVSGGKALGSPVQAPETYLDDI